MKISVAEAKHKLAQLTQEVHLPTYLTPQNLHTERKAFFQSQTYNPQFRYLEVPVNRFTEIQLELLDLDFDIDLEDSYFLQRKIDELKLEVELLLNLNTEKMTDICLKLFQGTFAIKYQEIAKEGVKLPDKFEPHETLSGEETAEKIREYLATEYGQDDWKVEVSDQGDFYVRVRAAQHTILVNRQMNWDSNDLPGLLAHEVDGHILRYLNGQKFADPQYRRHFPFYIKTEEGLASFVGDFCNEDSKISYKHHCLNYLAGVMSQTEDFRTVFMFLKDSGFTESLAFQRTFRMKRGIQDTSVPGCYTKEPMYFEGLNDVKEFIDSGGDVKKLFSGKFGLRDLEHIPNNPEVILPIRVEKYLKANSI